MGVRRGKVCFQGLPQKGINSGKKCKAYELGHCSSFQLATYLI